MYNITSMNIYEIIKNRRTIHGYTDEKVDEQIVEQALEACLYGLNHKHTQPWRFFVTNEQQKLDIANVAVELKKKKKPDTPKAVLDAVRKKFTNPSHLIVLGMKKSESEFQTKEDYAAIACGVQNMSLFLWEKGIGSKWSTGGASQNPAIYEWLDVDQNEIEIVGIFLIGIAEKNPAVPCKAELKDVIKRF